MNSLPSLKQIVATNGLVLCLLVPRIGLAICGDGLLDPGEECETPFDACCDAATCQHWGASDAVLDESTGQCYLGFATPQPWADAESSCEAIGGYLAVIDSASENLLARSVSTLSLQTWIGFNDIDVEAGTNGFGFVKVTGGNLAFDGFRPGEPNSNGDEDCVHFFENRTDWNDVSCTASNPFVCERDGTPGATPCTSTPTSGCLAGRAARLRLRGSAGPAAPVLSFRWRKGPPTTTSDFGMPTTTDGYSLCVYDRGALLGSAEVAGGGTCGNQPCWKTTATGYKFRDASAAQDGIRSIRLVASTEPVSRAVVRGKGTSLPAFAIGGLQLVTAKLVHAGSGRCFEATFTGSGIETNTPLEFNARLP